MERVSGLDLPEIRREHCLFACWMAATVQVVRVGQRSWKRKVKAGGFVVLRYEGVQRKVDGAGKSELGLIEAIRENERVDGMYQTQATSILR